MKSKSTFTHTSIRKVFPLKSLAVATLAAILPLTAMAQGGTVRIGMTASDIPLTSGAPNSGFEGVRFTGMTLYDALVSWDLSVEDKVAPLMPQLATAWHVDEADPRKWIFQLREGVAFHDGSTFNADAVVFNFDKVFNDQSPQYDARQAAQVVARLPAFESIRKLDDFSIEITTKTPNAMFINQLPFMFMSSPTHWEALNNDWEAFEKNPSGTGPFKLDVLIPRERAELVPFADYWDESRRAKADRLVLIPIPEANTRANALLSRQVDWIENPPADTLPMLQSRGFQITSNGYPHIWPWQFSFLDDSPWLDKRVRQAANLAVDRESIQQLLGGYMVPAQGLLLPDDAAFGEPDFKIAYDPDAARALLAEAGFSPSNPLKAKVLMSASGSGQMQPLQMNELIQQQLKDVGIEIEFEVLVWETLFNNWRQGATDQASLGAHATNITFATHDPFAAMIRFIDSKNVAPVSLNWGHYNNVEVDGLIADLQTAFGPEENLRIYQQLHETLVEDAPFLFVGHDTGPRAMGPKVAGFVQAKSWFQDLTPIYMED